MFQLVIQQLHVASWLVGLSGVQYSCAYVHGVYTVHLEVRWSKTKMASNAPLEDSLRHLLKCNVCLEQVDLLKALPCQHTICLTCVKQLTVRSKRFKCTICKKENRVPDGGFDQLPDSLLTKQISELIKQRGDGDSLDNTKLATTEETDDPDVRNAEAAKSPTVAKDEEENSKLALAVIGENDKGDDSGAVKKKEEIDVWRLRSDLEDSKSKANRNYEKAKEMVKQCKEVIEKLPENTEATKQAILEFEKAEHQRYQEKIKGVTQGVNDLSNELEEKVNKYQPYVSKMNNALKGIQKTLKALSAKECSRKSFTEAQKQLADLKSLMSEVSESWTEVEDYDTLAAGDSVRLKPGAEENRPEFAKKMMSSKVSHSTVGIFFGQILTRRQMHGIEVTEAKNVLAIFPEEVAFIGPPDCLIKSCTKAKNLPFRGDKVRLQKPGISRKPAKNSHGVLKSIEFDFRGSSDKEVTNCVIVDFPDKKDWRGNYDEIELVPGCGIEAKDKVRIRRSVPEPSTGWNGVNGSSVGEVTSVKGRQGQEKVIVNFPENKDWRGLAKDVELVREPVKGDKVQVKLSVTNPRLDWGGVTHNDVGELEEVREEYDSYGKVAEVKFPNRPKWTCVFDELELVRYQAPVIKKNDKDRQEVDWETLFMAAMFEQMAQMGANSLF